MRRLTTLTFVLLGLVGLCGANAYAEGGGFGLGAGIVKSADCEQDCETPLWLTANLRLKLNRNFALEPEAGWYRHKDEGYTLDGFNFGGSALVIIPTEKVDVWGGGGAGAHMFRAAYGGNSESNTKLGIHFLGGLDLKASETLSVFGAIRYEMIDMGTEGDFGDSDDTAKQWKFYGGIRLVSP